MNKKKPALFRGQDSLDTGLDAESGGEAKGIPGAGVARVAVRVHKAEDAAVVVVRRTLPPIRSGRGGTITILHLRITILEVLILCLISLFCRIRIASTTENLILSQ